MFGTMESTNPEKLWILFIRLRRSRSKIDTNENFHALFGKIRFWLNA